MPALLCPHQPSCPGCPRLATPGLPLQPLERLANLARQAGIAAPRVHTSAPTGFRRRARLAIRGRADSPKLGIFASGTHRVVHIPSCLVHHPLVNRVARATRDALAEHRVPTYSDTAHAGIARYLQVVVERGSERAQVVLVTNGASPSGLEPVFESLERALGSELHSLWWNGNPDRTNTILGPHWQHLSGPEYVEDRSGNARVYYPPSAFGQSNLDLAMELAASVRELARPGERVTEYYAGVGAISLGLAASVSALRLNELGEGSLAGLERGVQELEPPVRGKVSLHPGSAGAHVDLVRDSDLVIADPPRRGLDPELARALVEHPPARFAYVSCDLASLERDAGLLAASFKLTRLDVYELFPHTDHIETLALFERRSVPE